MRKSKIIKVSLMLLSLFIFTSCGASTGGLIFFWIQTVDDNAYYVKSNQEITIPENIAKSDSDCDYEDENISINSEVYFTGERFRFELPNIMHEIKEDPCSISLRIENKKNNIDFVKVNNVYLNMKEVGLDLLKNLDIGNDENNRNFDIWASIEGVTGAKLSTTDSNQKHLDFFKTKTYSLKPEEEYFFESASISFSGISSNKSNFLNLIYDIEIHYLNGDIQPIVVLNYYILKEETVKMYNPIFNK